MNSKKLAVLSIASVLTIGTLASCGNKDQKLAELVASKISITGDHKQATGNFNVPASWLHEGVSYNITWTENSDFIELGQLDEKTSSYEVKVTRPESGKGNQAYALVAEVEVNGKKATKTFDGAVTEAEKMLEATKVSQVLDGSHFGKTVKFTGKLVRQTDAGLWLVDDEGKTIFVYKTGKDLVPGDTVEVIGEVAVYKTLYQLGGKGVQVKEVASVTEGAELPKFPTYSKPELTVQQLFDEKVDKGHAIHGTQFKIEGVVTKDGKDYFINSVDDQNKKHQFYYKSLTPTQTAKLDKVLGKLTKVNVVFYTWHDRNDYAYLDYADVEGETEALVGTKLTEAQDYKFTVSAFKVPSVIATNLPSSVKYFKHKVGDYNKYKYAKVTYACEPAGLVSADGKVVVEEGKTSKINKLTATITDEAGANELKFEFNNLQLGIDKYTNVAQVYSSHDKTQIYFTKLNVIGETSRSDYIVEEGGKLYYVRSDSKLTAGKVNVVEARYDEFNGKPQFKVDRDKVIKVEEPIAPIVAPDTTNALALDLQAISDSQAKHLKKADAQKDPALKVLFDAEKNSTIVKFEAHVNKVYDSKDPTKFKYNELKTYVAGPDGKEVYLKGLNVKVNSDLLKDTADGDVVTAYAIVTGFNYHDDGYFTSVGSYVFKAEKKA